MSVVVAVIALGVTACSFGAAAPPGVEVAPPPRHLHVGDEWRVQVRARGSRPSAFVAVSRGRTESFRLVSAGGLWRGRVSFPVAGRWRYGVRIAERIAFVGSVLVRAAPPVLSQPFGILEEAGGTLLVADFRGNAVYRLDPVSGDGSVVVRVPGPRDLRWSSGGKALIASRTQVLELDPASGSVRPVLDAGIFVGGIAPAADGSLFVNEDGSRIVRVDPTGRRTVLAEGLNGVHGIVEIPAGLLVCETFAGNVLLIDEHGVHRVARGLGNPSYAAPAPGGAVYVTEFGAGRVSRLGPSGEVELLARVDSPGPVSLDRSGRVLVGTLEGRIFRIEPATRRVTLLWPARR